MDDFQPVALILLDINMPIMTGLEAIKVIKKLFEETDTELTAKNVSGRPQGKLIRPVLLFFSQYNRQRMKMFMIEEE